MNKLKQFLSSVLRTLLNYISAFIYIVLLLFKFIITLLFIMYLIFYNVVIDFVTDKILTRDFRNNNFIKQLKSINKEIDIDIE